MRRVLVQQSHAKAVVEAPSKPEHRKLGVETVSRLAGGRTPAATSELMDVTVGGDESGTAAQVSRDGAIELDAACPLEGAVLRPLAGDAGRESPGTYFRALPFLLILPLAACEADHTAARNVLADHGYTRIEMHATPFADRRCDWSEPFAIDFTGSRDGKRWAGTVCAASESLHDARLLGEREVGVAAKWDAFSRRELR